MEEKEENDNIIISDNISLFLDANMDGKENSIIPFIVLFIGIMFSINIDMILKYIIVPRIIDKEFVKDNTFSFNDLEKENVDSLLFTSLFIISKDMNSFLFINLVIKNNSMNEHKYIHVIKEIKLGYDK